MKKTIAYLKSILKDEDTIVLGLSGGPDSMCLLNVLLNLKIKLNIICIHINHGIRKESNEEYKFIAEYLKNKNVTLEYEKIPKKSSKSDYNEKELRKKRYSIFDQVCKKYKAKYLLTAHHGDDLIETILMRISRGSNLKGYSGFNVYTKKDNYIALKPLIYYDKETILKYNQDNNIPYVNDFTNNLDEYTRNRYRHHILPFLKKENSNIHLKYLNMSNELIKYYEYVDKIVNDTLKKVYVNKVLDIKEYKKLEPLIKEKILEYIIKDVYQDNIDLINNKHIKIIEDIISNNKPNISVDLPSNIKATKSYNNLIFETNKTKENGYLIKVSKVTKLPNNKTIRIIENTNLKTNDYLRLNSNEIKLPLYIRTRKDGDKMIVKNMQSPKKLKDIYINSKLTIDERINQPILVDSDDTILWIPGIKKSKFDKENNENYDIILWYN